MKCVDWSKNTPVLFRGEVRPDWCRNDERPLAFHFDVVITKLEPPSSQFAVPCHDNGFDFSFAQFLLSMRKCSGDILKLFHRCTDGLQYKKECERIGIPALLLHVEIKRLYAVQPRQLQEVFVRFQAAASGATSALWSNWR